MYVVWIFFILSISTIRLDLCSKINFLTECWFYGVYNILFNDFISVVFNLNIGT